MAKTTLQCSSQLLELFEVVRDCKISKMVGERRLLFGRVYCFVRVVYAGGGPGYLCKSCLDSCDENIVVELPNLSNTNSKLLDDMTAHLAFISVLES